ncbi:MAG: hypothetical protein Q9227_004464 [Pyrenula ochraceoflavens]
MASTVPLAEYLLTRLRQLNIRSVFGVPGDYNLELLDYVKGDLHWVGNCNELNAGYAADGYSRRKGLGALITTFGVGELSAINAIAGAYAELAPVVHIVGTPARQLQDSRVPKHHTFADGNYRRFAQMHAHITVAQASLRDPRRCPQLIDSTIQQCLVHSRPVYIEIPSDMVAVPVDASNLRTTITLPDEVPSKDEDTAVAAVLECIYSSQHPMILVDGESGAHGICDEISRLVRRTQWPTWTTIFGKGLIDESLPNVHGVWKGNAADAAHIEFVHSRDLILCFGPHFSTTNTFNGSGIPKEKISVLFRSTMVNVQGRSFLDLPSKKLLSMLLEKIDTSQLRPVSGPIEAESDRPSIQESSYDNPITQKFFYRTLSPFFRPHDTILAETGTAGHGCRDFKLPPQTFLFKPVTWLSIGYMLPAALAAALAERESSIENKKTEPTMRPWTILLIGDGSFQMTVQELSTIIREKLDVIVFLINNAGYTIERCLHGKNQQYNDVSSWRYLQAPSFMGASDEGDYPARTCQVKTMGELTDLLKSDMMRDGPGLRMVEVMMEKLDAPATLLRLLDSQRD